MIANDCHDRSLLLRRAGLYDQEVWGRLCLVGTRYCVSCKQIFIARVTIIIETPLFPSIHFTFGPFLAFIRLWIECIILRPCIGSNTTISYLFLNPIWFPGAIQSLTFALYLTKPFFPECDPPDEAVSCLYFSPD